MFASGFCFINGLINARYLTLVAPLDLDPNLLNSRFVLGTLIWALGFYGNVWHDRRLFDLKRDSGGVYVIPTGGLFEYISGANFFCEIVEWFGYAVASDFSYPATAFFIMTACNIGPRGMHHHHYYKEKFAAEYPKERKAIIPFLL